MENTVKPLKILDGAFILSTPLLDKFKDTSSTVRPSIAPGNELWIGQATNGYESLIIKCRPVNETTRSYHKSEVECLRRLGKSHQNIIQLYTNSAGTYVDGGWRSVTIYNNAIYGSIADNLPSRGGFTENIARTYFQQIASAVDFCHRNRICHTDICLENIYLDGKYIAKLGGFGRAIYGGKGIVLPCKDVLGNERYTLAPEVSDDGKGTYNAMHGDLWSLGVVCFVLLTGYPPFNRSAGRNQCWWLNSLFEGKQGLERFWHNQEKLGFSYEKSKPLLEGLFEAEPSKRMSAYAAKFHDWIVHGDCASDKTLALYMHSFCPQLTGLGLDGQTFRQNETYNARLSNKSGVEKYEYLFKNNAKNKEFDNINRSQIAQLGVQRAKELANDKGVYPKLEEMWLKACDYQLTIKPPEGDIITMYMQDSWTIADVLRGCEKRRGYEATKYLVTCCGEVLPEQMVIKEHKLFSRQNTVFRLHSKKSWKTKEKARQQRRLKKRLKDSIVMGLETIFQTLDIDNSGTLEKLEVIEGLGIKRSENGVDELLKQMPGLDILADRRLWEEAFVDSDVGGKGGLTLLEFSMFARKITQSHDARRALRKIFDRLDPLERGMVEKEHLLQVFGGDDNVRNGPLSDVSSLKILKKPGLYREEFIDFETKAFGHVTFEELVTICIQINRERGNIGDPDADKNNKEARNVSWTTGKWNFTGSFSKEALARRMKEEEDNLRREKKRLERKAIVDAEKEAVQKKLAIREQTVSTIKERYSHLTDFFKCFEIDDPLMDYEDFVDKCCTIFQDIRASGKAPSRSWGIRTAEEALPQEIWSVHHSYPSVKASGAVFRNLDPEKTGQITLKTFKEACDKIGYSFGTDVLRDLHAMHLVNDDFL